MSESILLTIDTEDDYGLLRCDTMPHPLYSEQYEVLGLMALGGEDS